MAITKSAYATKFHRDGTVTVWDVYSQSWRRTSHPGDSVLASLSFKDRQRVIKHCGLNTTAEKAGASIQRHVIVDVRNDR